MNPSDLRSGRVTNNDPWAILIALASLIIIATAIAIVVICVLWERYRKSRYLFERTLAGISYEMPNVANIDSNQLRPKEYEIQSLDMFVPPDDRDDLGEVHIGFTPQGGVRHIHHVKEMQLMQSQLPDQVANNKYNRLESVRANTTTDLNSIDKLNLKDSSLYRRVMNYTNLNF